MDADFRKVAWAVGDGLKEFAGSAEYHGQGPNPKRFAYRCGRGGTIAEPWKSPHEV
jgi:hypothetical protein